jgi:hypothetical protein
MDFKVICSISVVVNTDDCAEVVCIIIAVVVSSSKKDFYRSFYSSF